MRANVLTNCAYPAVGSNVVDEVYDELSKTKKELFVDYSLMIELATELARRNEDVKALIDIARDKLKQAGITDETIVLQTQIQTLFGDL